LEVLQDRYEEEKMERQMEKDLADMGLPKTLSSVDTQPIRVTAQEPAAEPAPTTPTDTTSVVPTKE
jgi:hypothetical protein